MKQLRYFFAIVASALLMVACQEDFEGDLAPNNGTLKVRFEVPTLDNVEITRGAVEETEAYDVRLYIFKGNNLVNHPYDIELNPTNENSYTRKYEVDTEINLEEGSYEVYAIANTESNSLWQGVAAFDAVETKTEFEALALTLNTIENTSKRMTLSGHATFTASASMPLAVDIQLSRPYAKVNFNVKSGSVNPNFKFTPTSYDIINVPTKAKMFANTTAVASSDFKNYTSRPIPQSGSFEFLQLENAYNVVDGPKKYTDREKRVSDTDRAFAYAPKNSTYVVIYGEGVETDENGHIIKISKTNYTIHLGDFSPTGNMGDYSVNRNTHYTYNVTVNGVNMIEVEAKRETADYENGAEGYVIDMSEAKQVYNLDAHYETVLLKLDISNIEFGNDASTVSGLTMSVSSPLMADADKNVSVTWETIKAAIYADDDGSTLDALYEKYDAKWVEFMPVATANFAAYKSSPMFYVCEFLNEVYKEKTAPAANNTLTIHTENGIDYIYVVAFINEYFYEGKPLSAFVNKPDREMKILQSPEVSTDGHSVYSEALCAFSQKSISTMFSLSAEDNIFGIETYDETGYLTSSDKGGESKDNGWANMKSVINGYTDWAELVNDIQGGYSYEGQPNGNTYDKLVETVTRSNIACGPQNNTTTVTSKDAVYACMQRNRDNNGDGIIDDDELRWYTPAHSQYCAFWFGEEALPTYARLYQGLTTDVKSGDEHNNLHHYFTSTYSSDIKNYRIIWAIEGSNNGAYPNGYTAATHNTRCIRNLRSVTGEPATAASQDGYILTVNNFVELAYRNTIQNGPYPKHHEREIANKLPHAFKVASRNLTDEDLINGFGGSLPTLNHVIEAPNISSAVSRDGKTTLTFADMVTDGTIGYYYTTTNTASQDNIIEATNNQATISGIVLTDDGGFVTKTIDISSATYQNNTLTLTLGAALPSDVTLYYATTLNGTKNPVSNNSCGNNPNVYVWASADNGETFSDSYATITTEITPTTTTKEVSITRAVRQGYSTNRAYYRITLSAALPDGVTLHCAHGSETATKYEAKMYNNNAKQYNCGADDNNATTNSRSYNPTYVWISADDGETYSEPITISGTSNSESNNNGNTISGTLSIEVETETIETTVKDGSLSVDVPVPPTGVLYIWAYDQAVRDFSNATIVTASDIQIGADKVVSEELTTVKDEYGYDASNADKKYNPKRDKLRLAATTMDLCAGYMGDNDPSDAPKWRVPNQRELTIMNLNSTALGMNTDSYGYFSSTQYSNAVNATKTTNLRFSYVIEAGGLLALVINSQNYAIRCVRDLAPSESNGSTPPTNSDGKYEGGW